ncbi:hypothetical protein [Parasitella parasitica]|uniref:Uncharacterized protein n=1 Tax=Parasitella parasitica TaxID=35722 RepID=A0A0B7NN34_9FUNG|nr:hypothetical protein [Parasitella parasitica]
MSHSTNNINDLLSTPKRRGRGSPPMSRACQFCNAVLDGYQALRNHRRSCRLNYQNAGQQEDVVMDDVSNQVDQVESSNIHSETLSEAYQDDALPDYTDDAMQIEAENGDASIAAMAPNNEGDADSNWDDESDNNSASMPDFHELPDNLLNVKYKTLGIVDDNTDDLACVYDCSTLQEIGENIYTTSELVSIELYDLVKDFTIPREAYRRLVRLMNTVIRDKEKLERETNPQIMHGPQVENMMKRQASFEAHSYDVCVNGCKLYNLEDEQTSCTYCNSRRFQVANPVKPLATMKMMSLGDIVSRLLANPDTRAELKYRHEYENRENPEPNVIADFFDGEEYKAFTNNDNFQSENDVAIALFNDGFVTTKRGGRLFTMIHVIVLSYDPQKRYKDEYLIQLCILPGKKKPASFASYLSVILAEMHYLSTYGMVVKTPDNQIIRSKVHCLAFGGDTLGKHQQV